MTSEPQASPIRIFFLMSWFAATLLFQIDALAGQSQSGSDPAAVILTNVFQVRLSSADHAVANHPVRLQGVVLWVSPVQDQLILQDDSGGVIVKMNLRNQPAVQAGDEVLIAGNGEVLRGDEISEALLDNDGVHSSIEKSGATFLSAGLHPITVEWFNYNGEFSLALDCQGPEMPRQSIPDKALFRRQLNSTGHSSRLVQGLNYSYYEGEWENLPNFPQLPVVKRGAVPNLTLQVRTRDPDVGLVFSGYFLAPRDGNYTFWLTSDDGAKFSIGDPLKLIRLGKKGLPVPRKFIPGQFASGELELQWVEVEGLVTRVREAYQGVNIELTFGAEHIYLKAPDGGYDALSKLLNSRIKALGIYQNAYGSDGQIMPSVLIPNFDDIAITEMDSTHWADYSAMPIESLAETNFMENAAPLVRTSGTVGANVSGGFLTIEDAGRRILMATGGKSPKAGDQVEVLGWWSRQGSNTVLSGGVFRDLSQKSNDTPVELPLLTKAIQVKSLSRSDAQRGYPVEIQGVVTARIDNNFVIQDATWSVFCYGNELNSDELPQIGEVWKIDGNSDVHFAPDILARQATYIGPGILPEPIRPTKDELINGSLDTQYIELQGIVTSIETNALALLTREGEVQLHEPDTSGLERLKSGLVRIRGVFIPDRDTNEMLLPAVSPIWLFNASISMDEPAPADSFNLPLKHISDLLHFDARADALRRVKIAGQVLQEHQGEYFLTDGTTGARFELKEPLPLVVGDLVQVVGFPDVSGPSPVLHEALARVSAKAGLPEATPLSEASLLNSKLDATLVSIESRLININGNRAEQTLELQTGTRSYLAHLANQAGRLPDILPGSLLKLTGVYAAQGSGRPGAGDINSFELLLTSPADVQVLERPSWWTVRHTLIVVGGMLLIILGALVWITLLHRQVEERTRQLASEIKGREQAEYLRALEAERTRIAEDLHDELGATLTEIRFLGAVKSRDFSAVEDMRSHLKEVSEKSHQMVSSLDEIVWAVNPANDSLPNLANYLCHLAEEFFRTAEMRCRLDMDELLPAVPLTSEVRHSLYLVVREALNNIAKHSQATEAWLRIHYREQALRIFIEDNGRGFVSSADVSAGNGLPNMRSRIQKIGGEFACDTRPGHGTVCRIYLPLS
jgi:signal transduction histidine kinase